MPDANLADNSVLTSAFWNTYVREQVVPIVTTATRPSNIEGRHISDTDTGRLHRGDGTSWDAVDVSPWTAYTPSWASGVTVGNGVYAGCQFRYVGGSIEAEGQFTLGSTSAITGAVTQTVPDSKTLAASLFAPLGQASFVEIGNAEFWGAVTVSTSTAVSLRPGSSAFTTVTASDASSTAPFTWGTGDIIIWSYRARLA